MNKLLNINNLQLVENSVAVDFNTNKIIENEINFDDKTIKSCGEILANYLIKYIKNGGDINNLTPEKVFKNNYSSISFMSSS